MNVALRAGVRSMLEPPIGPILTCNCGLMLFDVRVITVGLTHFAVHSILGRGAYGVVAAAERIVPFAGTGSTESFDAGELVALKRMHKKSCAGGVFLSDSFLFTLQCLSC